MKVVISGASEGQIGPLVPVQQAQKLLLAGVAPHAVLGERAVLEGGVRTATVTATTPLRVAVAEADSLDRLALAELSEGHQRERTGP